MINHLRFWLLLDRGRDQVSLCSIHNLTPAAVQSGLEFLLGFTQFEKCVYCFRNTLTLILIRIINARKDDFRCGHDLSMCRLIPLYLLDIRFNYGIRRFQELHHLM